MSDAWSVLGVSKSASKDECKSAYRSYCRKHHPDSGGDTDLLLKGQNAWKFIERSFDSSTNRGTTQVHMRFTHSDFMMYKPL